jgi:ABC-type Fe3+ transport system substrate-binding protein
MRSQLRTMPWLAALALSLVLMFAACSPSEPDSSNKAEASSKDAASTKQTPADWSTVVEAAKREGVVVCGCPPRPNMTQAIKAGFEAAYPGIRLDTSPAPLPEFWVRVQKEQEAGQYLWDIYLFGVTLEMFELKNKGMLAATREYLVGPDVGTDADWEGGLDGRFMDNEKKYIFTFFRNVQNQISVNSTVMPNTQIKSFQDLLDPALKGKIVWQDPRIGGIGITFFSAVYRHYGREGAKQLIVDQQPLLVPGLGELAEQLIRGARPIAMSRMSADTLVPYEKAGVQFKLATNHIDELEMVNSVANAPTVLKNPPHPNATKVLLNWIASKAGQEYLSKALLNNSARKGVPPGDLEAVPVPGRKYLDSHLEDDMTGIQREAQRVARELVP